MKLPVLVCIAMAIYLTACQSAAPPASSVAQVAPTEMPSPVPPPTRTHSPPTPTFAPATATLISPTATSVQPTATPVMPTFTPTLTREPLATASRTSTPKPRVKSGNLRAGPGTNYAVVGTVGAGTHFELLGRNQAGNWLFVRANGTEAWIAAFLVEQADFSRLPTCESSAPTAVGTAVVSPVRTPAAAPAAGAPPCGASVPAPSDLQLTTKILRIISGPKQIGNFTITGKELTWRWSGLDAVRGASWYFDFQYTNGDQSDSPLLRTIPVEMRQPNQEGLWTIPMEGDESTSGGAAPSASQDFIKGTCPRDEPQCRLHLRIQVAIRDTNGAFGCFISAPSAFIRIQ